MSLKYEPSSELLHIGPCRVWWPRARCSSCQAQDPCARHPLPANRWSIWEARKFMSCAEYHKAQSLGLPDKTACPRPPQQKQEGVTSLHTLHASQEQQSRRDKAKSVLTATILTISTKRTRPVPLPNHPSHPPFPSLNHLSGSRAPMASTRHDDMMTTRQSRNENDILEGRVT